MKIISKAQQVSFAQDYSRKPVITDVKVVELKQFIGEDGSFNEVVRIDQGKVKTPEEVSGFLVKQINYSRVIPGSIKSWHYHLKQDEIWLVHPDCKAIVGLLDIRQESRTKNLAMRLPVGDGKAHLIFIPKGVAHGVSNPYQKSVTMTYLINEWFNGSDELRLPYDFQVGSDFWLPPKG
jgi:dTDP-4-dehydrorhamnose 3,5-epimerase